MEKTRKVRRSFRADGAAILTRWPALVAFLLIAAFSGSGLHSASTVLQQCRQLLNSDGDNTVKLAHREQPRLAAATNAADKQTWPGPLDGVLPARPTIVHSACVWHTVAIRHETAASPYSVNALARGPPLLS